MFEIVLIIALSCYAPELGKLQPETCEFNPPAGCFADPVKLAACDMNSPKACQCIQEAYDPCVSE